MRTRPPRSVSLYSYWIFSFSRYISGTPGGVCAWISIGALMSIAELFAGGETMCFA